MKDFSPSPGVGGITTARFQAARHANHLTPAQRRQNRDALRGYLRPPGMIKNHWLLAEAFTYKAKDPDAAFTVPAQYEFDGASVPWLLSAFVPRSHSDILGAAALHDWLYAQAHESVPRRRADAVLREALQRLGLNWFWAMLMWRAVRVGGWEPWYARKESGFVPWFLSLPGSVRTPLSWAFMACAFLAGFAHDLARAGRFRAEGERICEEDC